MGARNLVNCVSFTVSQCESQSAHICVSVCECIAMVSVQGGVHTDIGGANTAWEQLKRVLKAV